MNKECAISLAYTKLKTIHKTKLYEIVVLENHMEEFEFGWKVPYQTKKFIETKDISYSLLGVGPLIIDRDTRKIYNTSSAPFDFVGDFCKYKRGEPHKIDWEEEL